MEVAGGVGPSGVALPASGGAMIQQGKGAGNPPGGRYSFSEGDKGMRDIFWMVILSGVSAGSSRRLTILSAISQAGSSPTGNR